jgi:acyl-coenzyme A synthetase/AMP-(fatty) acid ligase
MTARTLAAAMGEGDDARLLQTGVRGMLGEGLENPSLLDRRIAYVGANVAPYKRIRRVEFIAEIPKSATGKVLRRVLVERERATTRPSSR